MPRILLLLALLGFQDTESERLIRQLGDPDPADRERATGALAGQGSRARDALLNARSHPDPEVRSRAAAILFGNEPSLFLEELKKAQRPRKLKLLAGLQGTVEAAAFTDGAQFTFERQWTATENILGTTFITRIHPVLEGEIEWSISAVRTDRNLPLETCSVHSPVAVHVPELISSAK
jgi:hypothetical protein